VGHSSSGIQSAVRGENEKIDYRFIFIGK